MADPNNEALMQEFISERGLEEEFEAWRAAKRDEDEILSEPGIYVEYHFNYRRSGHKEEINVTPWLRRASTDDLKRLLAIDHDDLMDEEHPEHEFVDDMMTDSLDADQSEWRNRCVSTKIYFGGLIRDFVEHLAEIRPLDHKELRSQDIPGLIQRRRTI